MLFPLPPLRARTVRLLHTSVRRCDLVGPPDPVSHLRPAIYDDALPPRPASPAHHPYSLSEFTDQPVDDLELQWKLHRQYLDALSQDFWTDSNTRFEAGKAAVLGSLPASASAVDKENAVSEFYRQWVTQEAPRTGAYTAEWRRRNIANIVLAARVHYGKFVARIPGAAASKTRK